MLVVLAKPIQEERSDGLVEQRIRNAWVGGSSPLTSTRILKKIRL